ncbi:MAG: helix-turn-helix domain-containing protein [Solirubrobacteraceae bacterium]
MSYDITAVAALAREVGMTLTDFAAAHAELEADGLARLGLGKRQQEIADLPALNTDNGMRVSEIARDIDYDTANTHAALQALKKHGVVEELRSAVGEPSRWRLTPAHRGESNPYPRMAGLLKPGEWTTYDDISLAVHGTRSAAPAVERAAATLPHFPAPHRVLKPGGRIPAAWRRQASATAGCVRRLIDEGVRFDQNGRASRVHYVSWDGLAERQAA